MAKKNKPTLVIGIGASAGGLSPLQSLVKDIPANSGMAYIIVQHLDPSQKSLLTEILAKNSAIPVEEASDGQLINANHIYVIPPDTQLEVNETTLRLTKQKNIHGLRSAIDQLFRSLAVHCGPRAVGIVLSGLGSDGTAGLREIKAGGGIALVQNPHRAEHPDMPLSVIDAKAFDIIVELADIPSLLKSYVRHPHSQLKPAVNQSGRIEEATAILKTFGNFDLSHYKSSTVQRRIMRRMSLLSIAGYQDYLSLLRRDDQERQQLKNDLLINVTDFFRDPEAFKVLETTVIPEILSNLKEREEIRLWVPGCASGEEAYSLAIVTLEALSRAGIKNPLKIFATDIDEDAIGIARRGTYATSMVAGVPSAYLSKYFTAHDHHYKINNHVRDLISFAIQNVSIHPPFSRIHLISCRNLLIYLKKDIQEQVLSSFYFSLESHGFLFLGSSESLGRKSHLFRTINKPYRLYKKIPGLQSRGEFPHHTQPINQQALRKNFLTLPTVTPKQRDTTSRSERMRQAILHAVTPPVIVVDADRQVLYNHGKLKPFIEVPAGEPRNEVTQIVHPAMRTRLRSGLFKVKNSREKLSFHCELPVDGEDNSLVKSVRVELIPLQDDQLRDQAIAIVFYPDDENAYHTADGLSDDEERNLNQNLELELAETKEELQNTLEELETSTEELKSAHEEALSTNEELQSANEELEASSEELRSLNEELSTVNAQLKEKILQLQSANNDVENFFSSTDIATIFLNPNLEVQRYTQAAEQLLKMGPKDIGRTIFSLGRDLIDADLSEECRLVLQNFQPCHKEKQGSDGRWYIRQLTPYRTEDRRIEGVVIVFHDITELKKLSQRAINRERQQSVVAKLGMMALSGTDPEELMRQAVRQVAQVLQADCCKVLKYQPEQHNLLMVAGVGWQDGLVGKATVPDDAGSQAGYTLISKDPVIVKSMSEEQRFTGPDLLLEHDIVSGISCVINHSDPPYGVLGVHTKRPMEYTVEDANFLVSVANMLSTALKTKQHQGALYASEAKFRTLANAIPQLSWMTDETGALTWYNQRWYDYTGTTFETMQGWGWQKVHHPDHVERVTDKFKKHIALQQEWEDTFPLRGADGQYRWFLSRAMPIHDQEGNVIRWFGTNTDITDHRELEASLKEAIAKLEDTDQRKNEFLAILGHELRNPLAVLKGGAEILEAGIGDSQEVSGIMRRSIQTMAKLLDDLLDLSRVSRNIIEITPVWVNAADTLNNVLLATNKQAESKKQLLEVSIEDSLPVMADPTRLEQILSNVLSNAVKYTPANGVIKVNAYKKASQVVVRVQDNGLGIRPEVISRIFEPFYQVTPLGSAASGLGIGLSLVRKLTELHGGSIQVHSDGQGKGSTFELGFPLAVGDEQPVNSASDKSGIIAAGLKVALIDDNQDILLTFSTLLKNKKCQVTTASNGREGIAMIRQESPDIAFIDIGLPDMTGYDIATHLRSEGYSKVLVAASGYSHQEAREKSKAAGFDRHLAKPFNSKDIMAILTEVHQQSTSDGTEAPTLQP
jgi:two-component system CheB/CheR fusion protein